MKRFNLIRVASNELNGTCGVLLDGEVPFALTLEPPWKDNQPNVSCIPNRGYICKRVNSPKFGDTFEVMNVAGRSHILFHKGNYTKDTLGCILVGEQFESLSHQTCAIASSSKGFKEFKSRVLGLDLFELAISSVINSVGNKR